MPKKFAFTITGFIVVVIPLGAVKVAQIKQATSMPHIVPASGTWRYARGHTKTAYTWLPRIE